MVKRIVVGACLIVLLAAVVIFGGLFQYVVLSFATLLSVYEMRLAYKAKDITPYCLPLYIFALFYYPVNHYMGVYWMLMLFVLCIFMVMTDRVLNKNRNTEDALTGLTLFLYPMGFFMSLMLIGDFGNYELSRVGLMMAFIGPSMGDMFAYFVGISIGRHKLCPHLSPKKTIEGSVGGVIGGVLGGVIVFYLQAFWGSPIMKLPDLLILGFLCGTLGQIGDLFASGVKRWVGIKDFGSIFPGHGGIMDRLDSVLVCAPIIFLYIYGLSSNIFRFLK